MDVVRLDERIMLADTQIKAFRNPGKLGKLHEMNQYSPFVSEKRNILIIVHSCNGLHFEDNKTQ